MPGQKQDFDEEVERRVQLRVGDAIEAMPDAISKAVEAGMRRALSDEQLRKDFWAAGYRELEQHAGSSATQWLGRRIANIIITAAVAGILAWVVMSGRVK
jgi:hypothetical protein